MSTHAPFQAQRVTHDILERKGEQGLSPAELAQLRCVSTPSARDTLYRLVSNGVAEVRVLGARSLRFWIKDKAPKQGQTNPQGLFTPKEKPVQQSNLTSIAKSRLTLDPNEPAIVPPNVKITRKNFPADPRYTADPKIAGNGVITADWRERRKK